jgi:RNA recognition motif-containing protein
VFVGQYRGSSGSFVSSGFKHPRPILPDLKFAAQKGTGMKSIFVGNLTFDATEDSVRALFAQFGTVDRVNLIRDRDSGQLKGFGFVEMSNHAEANKAMGQLNGRDFNGQPLNVNEARPKTESSRSFGHGGSRKRW